LGESPCGKGKNKRISVTSRRQQGKKGTLEDYWVWQKLVGRRTKKEQGRGKELQHQGVEIKKKENVRGKNL